MKANPTFPQSGLVGAGPDEWYGTSAVDGDREPWVRAPVGSVYVRKTSATANTRRYVKRQAEGRDDDWGALGGNHVLQQYVVYTDFTDGGGAAGTLALTETIPAGAWVEQVVLKNLTGFTGDTSATITIGDGTDVDRYNTGTPSVFTTAVALDPGVPSGTKVHIQADTVTITITSGSDWGLVTAGAFTICIHYKL